MRNILIILCVLAIGWAGWDIYEDGQLEVPAMAVGLANYGLGLGVSVGFGESFQGFGK